MKRRAAVLTFILAVVAGAASANWTPIDYWGSYGNGDGYFSNPSGAAISGDGKVYVVDQGNHRLQYFTVLGTFEGKWGSFGSGDGQFNYPVAVAVGPNDYVYVADRANHRVQYFKPDGGFLGKWGSYGAANGSFKNPWGIAVSADGKVYVADSTNDRVQYFTSAGSFLGKWGTSGSGNGQFRDPRGVGVAPNNFVYVTDVGNNRVQYFTATGSFRGTWGSPGVTEGKFDLPSGIAYSASAGPQTDIILVADTGNNRIQFFNTTGSFFGTWGQVGSAVGSFNYPLGLGVAPQTVPFNRGGAVYVADTRNNRVQVFKWSDPYVAPSSFGKVKALFR
jgi:hypothetical protein